MISRYDIEDIRYYYVPMPNDDVKFAQIDKYITGLEQYGYNKTGYKNIKFWDDKDWIFFIDYCEYRKVHYEDYKLYLYSSFNTFKVYQDAKEYYMNKSDHHAGRLR